MRTYADRLIGRAYADLIFQVLEVSAKPMRCKEISQEISLHSDFPKLSPQYVRMQMKYMLHRGEIVRIEEPVPYSKRKTIYFALPSITKKEAEDEDEEIKCDTVTTVDSFVRSLIDGLNAFEEK